MSPVARHAGLVALRLLLALVLSVALPWAHMRFGAEYPGDGQEARADQLAVDQDRAGPADPDRAGFLGAGEAQVVAQDVDQPADRGDVELVGLAVDLEVDLHAILRLQFAVPGRPIRP